MSVPNNVCEGFFCFVKYTISHQIKEEMTMLSLDGCTFCIPNTVVMGKDHFFSFVFFKDNLVLCHVL